MPRPLLFVDVDGPLNPYRAKPSRRPDGYTTHRLRPKGWEPPGKPLRVWLNPSHGPDLLNLPYDLVWATTWEREANQLIGPRIGLPELPVMEFTNAGGNPFGLHPKTVHLVNYAVGRPFAWVDDEIGNDDRDYVAAHHHGPTLLHHVDPTKGLRPGDLATLKEWAADTALDP